MIFLPLILRRQTWYGGAHSAATPPRRIFWLGNYPYATISHNIKQQIPPEHFSTSRFGHHWIIYQSTRDPKIKAYYCNLKERCCREFSDWEIIHMRYSHNIKRQISPCGFQCLSFRPSLDNISIYMLIENQGILTIAIWRSGAAANFLVG